MAKTEIDLARHSRFTVINMMNKRANIAPQDWAKFQHFDWVIIETLTEEARDSYNKTLAITREYRKSQLSNIKTNLDFPMKMKIQDSANGVTKWLDITEFEFSQIEKALTR
jgi:hypothetical protein